MRMVLAEVEPLPRPGMLGGLMDGNPWLLTALLVVVGLGVSIVLRNQGKPNQGRWWLLGFAAAALALQVSSRLVVTERERMSEATMELVRATARADTASLAPMLAEDMRTIATISVPGVPIGPGGLDKQQTLAAVSAVLGGRQKVEDYGVLELRAQGIGPRSGRTQVRVRATAGTAPLISWWRVDWRKGADGEWKVVMIEALEIGDAFSANRLGG